MIKSVFFKVCLVLKPHPKAPKLGFVGGKTKNVRGQRQERQEQRQKHQGQNQKRQEQNLLSLNIYASLLKVHLLFLGKTRNL